MAINKIHKFADVTALELFLNGAIFGRTNAGAGFALVGKILTFSTPADSVTFTTGTNTNDPYTLYFKDVKAQLEAAIPSLQVVTLGGRVAIYEVTPTSGVVLAPTGLASDAAGLLGFDASNDSVGKVYTPASVSTDPPCWVWADSNNANTHVLYTWE